MVACAEPEAIPLPIVALNRWLLLAGISLGLLTQQPLLTTILFLLLLPAVVLGRRGSLVFAVGQRFLARQNARARQSAQVEDPRLMRFNNSIAVILLGLAQLAFLLGAPLLGWLAAGLVAVAAAVALAGFCFGCLLYYRFQLGRRRLLKS